MHSPVNVYFEIKTQNLKLTINTPQNDIKNYSFSFIVVVQFIFYNL